jgi:hypothetical protein
MTLFPSETLPFYEPNFNYPSWPARTLARQTLWFFREKVNAYGKQAKLLSENQKIHPKHLLFYQKELSLKSDIAFGDEGFYNTAVSGSLFAF